MNSIALEGAVFFLDSWLPYCFDQTDIPGLSIAISHQDNIIWSQTYGVAHRASQEPLTKDHLFCVASQSKMFTTVAVLQLVQKGLLHLDTPACSYLPWLSKHADVRMQEITVRQLLSHSAGLSRDLPDSDFWQLRKPFPDITALQKAVLQTKVVLEPNTKLKYSNLGYALLGQIIESITRQPYMQYITENIIKKLGLDSTFADYTPALSNRLVTGYGVPYNHGRLSLSKYENTGALISAVGVHATAEDMCHFGSALCYGNDSLLTDTAKKEAQRSQWVMTSGYDSGLEFGLGFEILTVNDRRLVGHSGHLAGNLTATFIDPKEQLVVAVMANCKDAPSTQIVTGIFEALDYFGQYGTVPTPKNMARFNARLYSPIANVEIVATADRLVAIDPTDWQPFAYWEELEQISPTTLRITTDGSVFNEGEYVHYDFNQDMLNFVTYAGCTLLPEKAYKKLLEHDRSIAN